MANPAEDASYGDSKQNVRFFFSSNGNALALWQQYRNDDTPHKTWTNRYTVGTGWSTAEQFDNTPGDDFSPEIVGDALGNAFALCQQLLAGCTVDGEVLAMVSGGDVLQPSGYRGGDHLVERVAGVAAE